MPEYRRVYIKGGTYFFTVVTYNRQPILVAPESRKLLHDAIIKTQERYPFNNMAMCLLPDHLHCVWTLPEGDSDYSIRWSWIKRLFSKAYLVEAGAKSDTGESLARRRENNVWQRRFWAHVITDECDLNRHVDYIHFNPVKHGLVSRVVDWQWSSFHRYVKSDVYSNDWGGSIQDDLNQIQCGE